MTSGIIITACLLILIAYVFDFTAGKTGVPTVILLLALGYLVRQLSNFFGVGLLALQGMLPLLGTVGLVLIVLEGSLELELNRSKLPLVGKSFTAAVLPLFILAFGLAAMLFYASGHSFRNCLSNAIPLAIISSSVAIPSARNFISADREFITYESSISDIVGVIFFNFVTLHAAIGIDTFGLFLVQLLVIILISFAATGGLSFLLSRIDHKIKFVPIIFLIILIYEISKELDLPSLLFIVVLGLFLNNLDEMKKFSWIQRLRPRLLRREIRRFKETTIEGTFLVRALFFLLFGYLIQTNELFNQQSLLWSAGITAGIFLSRAIVLKLLRIHLLPLVFIAPRGLISILLFLSLKPEIQVPLINRPVLIQVIVMSSLVVMAGTMMGKNKKEPMGATGPQPEQAPPLPDGSH